jgi:hypothetical protein
LKHGYQCSARPVPVISSQVDFMQVLTYPPANMPGWCVAGLKASDWRLPGQRAGAADLITAFGRLASSAICSGSLVDFVLGLIGGGGSILAVPLLVYG